MEIQLSIQCPTIRKEIGWEGKSEDVVRFEGGTIADVLKSIPTSNGETFYDRFIRDDHTMIANAVIWHNVVYFVQRDELDRKVNDGDKIVLLRRIPGGGG